MKKIIYGILTSCLVLSLSISSVYALEKSDNITRLEFCQIAEQVLKSILQMEQLYS